MVIICPGGGFLFKSPNEGKDVADYFYRQGFNAAVLDYAVSEDLSAMPGGDAATRGAVLEDAKRAVRVIRHMAKNLNIKPDKIAIGGFSAGGILTSMLLTNYDSGIPDSEDEIERNSSRPDAAFHMYGSFTNAVLSPAPKGLGYDSAKRRELAASDFILNMPVDAPPIFLAQTNDDDPGNILAMGQAFYQRGVEFEIHLFTGGAHGGGLFDGKHADSPLAPHAAHWAELAAEWFEIQGF
jgi:acetyl esterase/lipase